MSNYKPEGSLSRPICIIGEAPAKWEMKLGKPFQGPAGNILNECLHHAKIIRRDCYITNVFDFPVYKKKEGGQSDRVFRESDGVLLFNGNRFTEEGLVSGARLLSELSECRANVYVPMGNPALYSVLGRVQITKWRGSILKGTALKGRKCIPTIHPASTLPGRGPFVWQHLIKHDMCRVKEQMEFPEIKEIPYDFGFDPPLNEIKSFFLYIKKTKCQFAWDIEVANHQISRISFAISPMRCITVPFNNRWTVSEELELWIEVAEILEDEEITKIGQNLIFDNGFIFDKMHIYPKGPIKDTMVAWSLMYPEFEKGLALLTSIFTDQPYYKAMVKHGKVENEYG